MSITCFRIKLSYFTVLLIAALLAGGCLFEPRQAEVPVGDQTSWVVPDAPSKVFVNMTSGLNSLSGTNYEKSLGTSFAFIPLPGDESQFPGAFDGWNRDVEIQVLTQIIGDAASIEVQFSDLTLNQKDISFAQYEGKYDLTIISKAAPDTSVYKAKARFDLQEGSKGWELVKWEDIEAVAGFPSWGFLRGSLRSP
jgi:hypothetical protein